MKKLNRHLGIDSTTPLLYLRDMQPKPLYSARNLHPSYRLYYDWSGWPSVGSLPAMPKDAVWDAPDHLHAAMRGNAELSPEEIALAFQNNLAFVLGQRRVWENTYYVGTFGEYDLKVLRGGPSGG